MPAADPHPRILVPSIIDPATFRGGAATATRALIGLLAGEPLRARVELLPSRYPRSRARHLARQVASVVRSLGSNLPSKAIFQCAQGYRDRLRRRLARRDYDAVLINGSDLLFVREDLPPDVPVIAWFHNVEADLFARQLGALPGSALLRRLFARDVAKLRRMEAEGLRCADGAIFLSSSDAHRLRRGDGPASLVVPPLFDDPPPPSRGPRARSDLIAVGFLGNLDWWPNRDALGWFLDEVLPSVRRRIVLHLFGVGTERFRGVEGVVAHGWVPDLSQVWDACDAMVCPGRTGGGVNVKVAEALHRGVPLLATPFAIQGLPVAAGEAVAVLEEARDWVRFLDSEALTTLVRATVPPQTRAAFCASTHRAAIAGYFRAVIEGRRAFSRAASA